MFFYFQQKTAYEMRISDGVQTCALPICAAWMEQHVGSEFDGVISGVTSFGLFIELDESKVNGLVHVTQLPNDYYHFDPIRKTLTGERSGRQYRLGDRA